MISNRELFEKFERAQLAGDANAQADLFAPDGVFEAPLSPGGEFPRRIEGRDEIRRVLAGFHARNRVGGDVRIDRDQSQRIVHETTDPAVFVTEIDVRMHLAGVERDMSLVQIYRVHDGQIVLLRDYFSPDEVAR